MNNYEPGLGRVQHQSSQATSRSSLAFRYSIARWLDKRGLYRKAFRVRLCRPRKRGGHPCKERILCDYCRDVDTLRTKRDYTARLLAVVEGNPGAIVLAATLTMGEAVDCEQRVKELRSLLKRLLRRSNGAWSKVLGLFWILHAVRGLDPALWRPHYHCVLVVCLADFLGLEKHPRRLATAWGRGAWAVLHPSDPAPDTKEAEAAFRDFMLHQHVTVLDCFNQSPLISLQHAKHARRALTEDVFALVEYGKKRKVPQSADQRSGKPRMWPKDYGEVSQMPFKHRGLKGALYNVPSKVALAGAASLEKGDHL